MKKSLISFFFIVVSLQFLHSGEVYDSLPASQKMLVDTLAMDPGLARRAEQPSYSRRSTTPHSRPRPSSSSLSHTTSPLVPLLNLQGVGQGQSALDSQSAVTSRSSGQTSPPPMLPPSSKPLVFSGEERKDEFVSILDDGFAKVLVERLLNAALNEEIFKENSAIDYSFAFEKLVGAKEFPDGTYLDKNGKTKDEMFLDEKHREHLKKVLGKNNPDDKAIPIDGFAFKNNQERFYKHGKFFKTKFDTLASKNTNEGNNFGSVHVIFSKTINPLVDVSSMQSRAFPGASEKESIPTFQIASNFNALETVGEPDPATFIQKYYKDKTQGPIASISALPGLIYRNYFLNKDGNPIIGTSPFEIVKQDGYKKRPVNLLEKTTLGKHVENGYIKQGALFENQNDIDNFLNDDNWKKTYVAYQSDMDVVFGGYNGKIIKVLKYPSRINQVFTAALYLGSTGYLDLQNIEKSIKKIHGDINLSANRFLELFDLVHIENSNKKNTYNIDTNIVRKEINADYVNAFLKQEFGESSENDSTYKIPENFTLKSMLNLDSFKKQVEFDARIEKLAKKLLYIGYASAILAAKEMKSKVVVLNLLGGGVFKNPFEWIAEAMKNAITDYLSPDMHAIVVAVDEDDQRFINMRAAIKGELLHFRNNVKFYNGDNGKAEPEKAIAKAK